MHLYSLKYYLIILIAIIGLCKPIIAQSTVFNQNFNYTGNVFTAPNGNEFFNNESFFTVFENYSNNNISGVGYSFNNKVIFPNLIPNEVHLGIYTFEDTLKAFNLFNYLSFGKSFNSLNGFNYLTGAGSNSTNSDFYVGVIIKTDGSTENNVQIVNLGKHSVIRGGVEDANYQKYFYGFVQKNDSLDYQIFVLESSENDSIVDTIFIDDLYYLSPSDLIFDSTEDTLVISAIFFETTNFRQNWALIKVNKYDKSYTIKTYHRGANTMNMADRSSVTFNNQNFFLVGSTRVAGGGPWPTVNGGLLIKTDAEGNELWQKTYNRGNPEYSEFFNGIKAHPDGTLIVAGGTRDYSYTPTPSYPRGWLIKMDTEGNIIWERVLSRYHEYNWDDYVNDVLLTSDGGIALAGYVIHNGIQDALGIYHRNDAWLVKTDSCGYTTGDVPEPLILVQSNQELTIQLQNATQNYCTATLTWGDGTEEQIYAYSEQIYGYSPNLTHTYTQPGTYQVCIEALAGEEFRTYCTEVIVSPLQLPQRGRAEEAVKIYPNPTSNYFILEINHPPFGGSEGGYSLPFGEEQGVGLAYSPTGQLIHQFEIKPQLQQKIDISHLPEGVYIIKIETNQFSTSKKLVVVR